MSLPQPLPDNPNRWDGWRNYNSENPYERLCLLYENHPGPEQIEDHCRQLLVWWQKKLPLKNQPSNPLSQMLRAGLDDAPRYLAEARTLLLNPETRREVDLRIRARLKETAAREFHKFLAFALADGVLTEEDEANLYDLGAAAGLSFEDMKAMVEESLASRGARRQPRPGPSPVSPSGPLSAAAAAAAASGQTFVPIPNATAPPKIEPGSPSGDPKAEFARLLRLTGLSEEDMTDDQRDALCNMGENLGLTGGQAEDVIDEYLEEVSGLPPSLPMPSQAPPAVPRVAPPLPKPAPVKENAPKTAEGIEVRHTSERFQPPAQEAERQKHHNFTNAIGLEMRLVTSGSFMMGSAAPEAAPNEQPPARTNVSCFFMSRFPVTNAQYERFDPGHRTRRAPWADDHHPVVYVSSLEAMKFCEWLSTQDRHRYRLPTEAEWEYAARGVDGRTFPWGEQLNRNDLANFADSNTAFAWRDPEINDGFSETAPVGTYPRGASPFGIEDLAGNVWEWCLDIFEPYKGKERTNPQSVLTTGKRIYRGGSWKSRATSLRASARGFNIPEYSANDVGFRVVCACD